MSCRRVEVRPHLRSDGSAADVSRKLESMARKLILVAMGVAAVVALICIADLAAAIPFGRYSVMMDVLYLISAGLIGYMGFETYREQG